MFVSARVRIVVAAEARARGGVRDVERVRIVASPTGDLLARGVRPHRQPRLLDAQRRKAGCAPRAVLAVQEGVDFLLVALLARALVGVGAIARARAVAALAADVLLAVRAVLPAKGDGLVAITCEVARDFARRCETV